MKEKGRHRMRIMDVENEEDGRGSGGRLRITIPSDALADLVIFQELS